MHIVTTKFLELSGIVCIFNRVPCPVLSAQILNIGVFEILSACGVFQDAPVVL